ncbi:hypothetical protein OCU04_012168 [Sclerotinia nivalis]|uniref:Uncharacterized protein n=1 Tax=Sclerotinia nivalis TaxID=352851 RepID=A0A9X0AAI6_9HELO|nr:hypothetical protein OCU04_012168 [Sclerotinia nivalis]
MSSFTVNEVATNNENGSNSTTSTPLSRSTSVISLTLTEPIAIAENLEACPSVERLVQHLEGHQFGSLLLYIQTSLSFRLLLPSWLSKFLHQEYLERLVQDFERPQKHHGSGKFND